MAGEVKQYPTYRVICVRKLEFELTYVQLGITFVLGSFFLFIIPLGFHSFGLVGVLIILAMGFRAQNKKDPYSFDAMYQNFFSPKELDP